MQKLLMLPGRSRKCGCIQSTCTRAHVACPACIRSMRSNWLTLHTTRAAAVAPSTAAANSSLRRNRLTAADLPVLTLRAWRVHRYLASCGRLALDTAFRGDLVAWTVSAMPSIVGVWKRLISGVVKMHRRRGVVRLMEQGNAWAAWRGRHRRAEGQR